MININESFGLIAVLSKLKPYDRLFKSKHAFSDTEWVIEMPYTSFRKASDYRFGFTKPKREGIYFLAQIEFEKFDLTDEEIKKHIAFLKKQFILFDAFFEIAEGRYGASSIFNITNAHITTERELQVAINGIKKTIPYLQKKKSAVKRL